MPIITLTTDFGNDDPFDGVMKGVILGICPEAEIIDLTHNISPQDIYQANFILQSCYQYFPKGAIHICVVDPGVGSLRKPVLIETKNYFFIGPDNGLFTGILEKEEIKNAVELTEKKYWLPNISQTFHGRDIFAPVAAHLAKISVETSRWDVSTFGKTVSKDTLVKIPIRKFVKNKNHYEGIVQYIDHFGNLITNVPNSEIAGKVKGKIKNCEFEGLVKNFAEASDNTLTAIKGSSGYMELFIYKDNAARLTNAKAGDNIEVKTN